MFKVTHKVLVCVAFYQMRYLLLTCFLVCTSLHIAYGYNGDNSGIVQCFSSISLDALTHKRSLIAFCSKVEQILSALGQWPLTRLKKLLPLSSYLNLLSHASQTESVLQLVNKLDITRYNYVPVCRHLQSKSIFLHLDIDIKAIMCYHKIAPHLNKPNLLQDFGS